MRHERGGMPVDGIPVTANHFVGRIEGVVQWRSAMDESYGVGVLLSPLLAEIFTAWGTNNPTASAA